MISFNLEDKFLITGASSGIGQAIVVLLNSLGATVIGVSSNQSKLQVTKEICPNPNAFFYEVRDLSENLHGIESWVVSLATKYGKFRGLVNCAGSAINLPFSMIDDIAINEQFNLNYTAAMLMTKGFSRKQCYIKDDASVVFISSIATYLGEKSQAIYAATKASLVASSKVLANELGGNIRVNCVSPGVIKTAIYKEVKTELGHYPPEDRTLLKAGEPEDVANLVVFLLSRKAKWITAQNYVIDGGYF